jgi:hypothetical protein
LSEYNDAVQRANRLAAAHEAYLNGNISHNLLGAVQLEDVEIYLRWLITNFYSLKSYMHFMKLLEWFPLIDSTLSKNVTLVDSTIASSKFSGKHVDSKQYSTKSHGTIDYLYLPTTTPLLPTEDTINALSFCMRWELKTVFRIRLLKTIFFSKYSMKANCQYSIISLILFCLVYVTSSTLTISNM